MSFPIPSLARSTPSTSHHLFPPLGGFAAVVGDDVEELDVEEPGLRLEVESQVDKAQASNASLAPALPASASPIFICARGGLQDLGRIRIPSCPFYAVHLKGADVSYVADAEFELDSEAASAAEVDILLSTKSPTPVLPLLFGGLGAAHLCYVLNQGELCLVTLSSFLFQAALPPPLTV